MAICRSHSNLGVSVRCATLQASRFWAGASDSDDDEEKATASEEESTDDSSSSDSDAEQKKGPSRLNAPGCHSCALTFLAAFHASYQLHLAYIWADRSPV